MVRWLRWWPWRRRRPQVRRVYHPETFEDALRQYIYWSAAQMHPRERVTAHWECDLSRFNEVRMLEGSGPLGFVCWPGVRPEIPDLLVGLPIRVSEGGGGIGGWPVLVPEPVRRRPMILYPE